MNTQTEQLAAHKTESFLWGLKIPFVLIGIHGLLAGP